VANHVILEGVLTYVGQSSMEISVGVWAENPFDGTRVQTTQAFLTFVAIGKDGKPTRVPRLKLENKIQERLFKEAERRAQLRSQNRKSFRDTVGAHPPISEIIGEAPVR
jgi:acyl-CoA hydrolase